MSPARMRRWLLWCAAVLLAGGAHAQHLTLASTTSTEHSGLFAHLLPLFTAHTGIAVKVVAVGTGQALDIARRGDADALLVHDRAAEEQFVLQGHGVQRFDVMYNDFVLVGLAQDPARVAGADIVQALRRIAQHGALFFSRGDHSGTHAAELRFWSMAGLGTRAQRGPQYKECGCGMGQALNMAAAAGGYVLSDRATWLGFAHKGDLRILVQGDRRLLNQYGVIAVNAQRHPQVQAREAQTFVQWIRSARAQAAIDAYTIGGEQLFFANAQR